MKVGVLTGGGDCPGLNAVIHGVVSAATNLGWDVIGFRDGFEDFATNNVEIVGVSFDSADSHLKFIAKYKRGYIRISFGGD